MIVETNYKTQGILLAGVLGGTGVIGCLCVLWPEAMLPFLNIAWSGSGFLMMGIAAVVGFGGYKLLKRRTTLEKKNRSKKKKKGRDEIAATAENSDDSEFVVGRLPLATASAKKK